MGPDTLGLSIKSTTQSQKLRREELKECTATCDKTDSMRARHAEGGLRGTGLTLVSASDLYHLRPGRTGLGKLGEEGPSASNLLFAVTPKKEEGV